MLKLKLFRSVWSDSENGVSLAVGSNSCALLIDAAFVFCCCCISKGVEGDFYEFFRAALAEGKTYSGFEAGWVNLTPIQLEQLIRAREEFGLDFAAMVLLLTRH